MGRRPSLGAGIEYSGLTAAIQKRLRAHGIVTCAQLHDFLERMWRDAHTRALFGISLAELRNRLGASVQHTVGSSLVSVLARRSFRMPPLTGIYGPTSESAILRLRRAGSKGIRRQLITTLRRIRSKLPSKKILNPWCTSVGDQGSLGSCTGWGSTANRELLARTELAPLFGYALAKYLDGRPDLEGSWQHFCFEGFARFGHLPETDYPYTDRPTELPVAPYLDQAEDFKANGFADVLLDAGDMELQPILLKAILAGCLNTDLGPQPVSTSLAIYESWNAASTSLYGLVTVPIDGEVRLGGHAMCITGYIDGNDPAGLYSTDYFIVKNSWGSGWAPRNPLGFPGYALVPAAYFTKPQLHWEALVCLAENSPVSTGSWMDLLRVAWDHGVVTAPTCWN